MPSSDGDFNAWLQNFVDYVAANAPALNVSPAEVATLQNGRADWNPKYATNITAQAAAQSARQAKDDSRDENETAVRSLVGRLQSTTTITDAQRLAMGINVRAGTRTPVGAPTTKPVPQVDTSQRLQQTISFVDELTPASRAKPPGAQGCEIWQKIGDPAPAGPNDLKYLATDTRSPYLAEFDAADGGKTAYYMLRWVSSRGETGPWSQTVSATITA